MTVHGRCRFCGGALERGNAVPALLRIRRPGDATAPLTPHQEALAELLADVILADLRRFPGITRGITQTGQTVDDSD